MTARTTRAMGLISQGYRILKAWPAALLQQVFVVRAPQIIRTGGILVRWSCQPTWLKKAEYTSDAHETTGFHQPTRAKWLINTRCPSLALSLIIVNQPGCRHKATKLVDAWELQHQSTVPKRMKRHRAAADHPRRKARCWSSATSCRR